MYCRNCYYDLADVLATQCPRCGRPFDPQQPATYLPRPFPDRARVIKHLLITTAIALAAAFIIACFQLDRASGH